MGNEGFFNDTSTSRFLAGASARSVDNSNSATEDRSATCEASNDNSCTRNGSCNGRDAGTPIQRASSRNASLQWEGLNGKIRVHSPKRQRSRTEIFNDVVSTFQLHATTMQNTNRLTEGEGAAAFLTVVACCVCNAVKKSLCFPPLNTLIHSHADSHKLVKGHEATLISNLPFKTQVYAFLHAQNRSLWSDVIQSVLAVVSSALYVYETYATHVELPDTREFCQHYSPFTSVDVSGSAVDVFFCSPSSVYRRDDPFLWLAITEACFALIYALDYTLRLYVSQRRLKYIFSLLPIADVITVVPVVLYWGGVRVGTSFGFVRVVRLLRLFRVLKAYNVIKGAENSAIKQANILLCTVFSLVFVAAGLIHWAEKDQGISFGDSVYFIVVTMATVGYGDYAPQSTFGKVVIVVLILIAIVLIPVQTRQLVDLISEKPREMFKNIPCGQQGYVILAGHHLTHDDVYTFIKEFYNPTHNVYADYGRGVEGYSLPPAVIVVSKMPLSNKLRQLLASQEYKHRMRYVLGSLLEDDTLRKIKAQYAKSCFVFATGSELKTSDKQGRDMATSLQTLNFRSFTNYQTETYCLLHHHAGTNAANAASADHLLSLDETRLKLMAQSCLCPGLSTLVINFITSYREDTAQGREKLRSGDVHGEQDEYKRGMSQVVFEMQVPKQLVGLSFIEAAVAVYMKFHITLMGVIKKRECAHTESAEDAVGSPLWTRQGSLRRSTLRGVRDMEEDFLSPTFSKAQATETKIGSMYRKLPEFNFVLNPGHRYKLQEQDVLAVISVDMATCEVCQGYSNFPVGARHNARQRRSSPPPPPPSQSPVKSDARDPRFMSSDGSIMGSYAGTGKRHRPSSSVGFGKDRRRVLCRRRLKGFIWAIVSLLKLRPVNASLPERTVLDVNAARIKHRHYVAKSDPLYHIDSPTRLQREEAMLAFPGLPEMQESEGSLSETCKNTAARADGAAVRQLTDHMQHLSAYMSLGSLPALRPQASVPATSLQSVKDWKSEGVFKEHIIVTGGQRNLAEFIRNLKRSLCATKTPLKTVIYLAKTPPAGELWNRVSHYRFFYFCQGDPKISNDLYRAGIEDASSLVILAQDEDLSDGEPDAETVFITMAAMNLCPVDPELTNSRLQRPVSDSLRMKIAAGILKNRKGVPVLRRNCGKPLFIIAELSSTMSVKYFNDFDVLQSARSFGLTAKETTELRMKTSSAGKEDEGRVDAGDECIEAFTSTHQLSSFYSAGFLISNQMLGAILPHAYYTPSLVRIVEQFMQGSLNQYGSFLGSIPVPQQYIGKTYGEMYYNLAVHNEIIPLGLYRFPNKGNHPLPFVCTNPPKSTIVREEDMVYVLQSGEDMEDLIAREEEEEEEEEDEEDEGEDQDVVGDDGSSLGAVLGECGVLRTSSVYRDNHSAEVECANSLSLLSEEELVQKLKRPPLKPMFTEPITDEP